MKATNDQVAGVYYTTTDYRKFKKLLGNRAVTEKRVNAIIDSIKRVGYVSNPITVNEKFEVIDGQGRLAALEKLGLPVEYILINDLTLEHCVSMNVKMTNWKLNDFVDSYAEMGAPDYVALKDLKREFPKFNYDVLAALARDNIGYGGSGSLIKEGRFKFTADPVEVRNTLRFIANIQGRTKGLTGGPKEMPIAFCYKFPGINKPRLEEILVRDHRAISIPGKAEDVVQAIEISYNKRLGSKNMLPILHEYQKASRRSCPNYEIIHGDKRREGQS